MENKENNSSNNSWFIFIGCMFVGMGVGAAINQEGAGTMVGMGIGFLASTFFKDKSK